MDLALLTSQRREGVAAMRFDDIVNRRFQVTQDKTGTMISFPLDLEIKSMNLKLGTIIDRCRLASTTGFMISAGIRKNSNDGSLHLDSLTKNFAEARIKSGLIFQSKQPTFHELRTLSGRLYEKEKGKILRSS